MSSMAIMALAFATGVALGNYFPVPAEAALAALALSCALAVLTSLLDKFSARSVLVAVFVAGWARPAEIERPENKVSIDKPCYRVIEGAISAPPTELENKTTVVLDMEYGSVCLQSPKSPRLSPVSGRLYITVPGVDEDIAARAGDRVRLRGKIKSIVPFLNRGRARPESNEPLYAAFVETPDSMVVVEKASFGPERILHGVRLRLARFWRKALTPKKAALARALTLGESRALDSDQRERFRRTGTAHLLSVSGLHLGLAVVFVYFLIRRALLFFTRLANRTDVGRIAAAISIPWAIAFTLLTGSRTPIVRACTMAVSALTAKILGRRGGTIEAIAVAGAAILVSDPRELVSPGFQLSFAAVMAFVSVLKKRERPQKITTEIAEPRVTVAKRALSKSLEALARLFRATLAAAAATSPLALWHFGYFSWVSVFTNMLAVPLTSLVILPGLLLVSAAALTFPGPATLAAKPLGALLGVLDRSLEVVSQTPCTLENPSPLAAVSIVIGCLAALALLTEKKRAGMVLLILTALVGIAGAPAFSPRIPRGKLTLDFLDVGQGDSTLITFPGGEHWLVDAGGTWTGRFDVGERVVVPALRSLGVSRLDKLILTHPDSDHVGGMPAVLDNVEVGEIWENGQGAVEGADDSYRRVLKASRHFGIPVRRTPSICGLHCVAGACVNVVHPCFPKMSYDPTMDFNDNSLVLLLRYGLVTVGLTGDIELEAERILVERDAVGHLDVLKLAHHGSGTSSSSDFLRAASPWLAVASLGRFNRHRFPNPKVVERLTKKSARIMRTDRLGAVRIVTDGRFLSAEGMAGRSRY